MGILDWMMGSGEGSSSPDNQKGPYQYGLLDRMTAAHNPNFFAAQQGRREQQKIYNAAAEQTDPDTHQALTEAMKMALTNPQFFAANQQHYFPQNPELLNLNTPEGPMLLNRDPRSGGIGPAPGTPGTGGAPAAGGIAPAPGTTTSPTAAIAPSSAGAPAAGGDSAQMPPPAQPGSPKMGSLPGVIPTESRLLDNVNNMKLKGYSRDQIIDALPATYRDAMKALVSGAEKLSDIAQRDPARKNTMMSLGAALGLDEALTAARSKFVSQYNDTNNGMGIRLQRGDTMLDTLGNIINTYDKMNTINSPHIGPLTIPPSLDPRIPFTGGKTLTNLYNDRANRGTDEAGQFRNLTSTFSKERDVFLGGTKGGGEREREANIGSMNYEQPRKEAIGAFKAQIKEIENAYNAMDKAGESAFANDPAGKTKYMAYTQERRAKVAAMKEALERMEKGGHATAPSSPASSGGKPEIRYDKRGNAFVRDADGNVVPYKP